MSGLTTVEFTALSLTPGYNYTFEVKARNVYGFSAYSNTVIILAA